MRQLTPDQLDARKEAMRIRAMVNLECAEARLEKLNEILPVVEADRARLGAGGRRKRVKPLALTAASFGVKTLKVLNDPRS